MAPGRPIRLVVADDHPIVIDGLEALFALDPDEFRVVARASNGTQALDAVHLHRPDIALLDIRMPAPDGITVLRQIRLEQLPVRVILLAATVDEDQAMDAIRAGVDGILLKELAPQLVKQCVRKVAAGERWLEKQATSRIIESMIRREAGTRDAGSVLTPREIELVRLAADGMRNKEISRRLQIKEGTVKIHLHNVYEKLGITNRVQLLLYAQQKGLV
jgi:two-component system, NarL family, nitrate/nitrite response regulator NarL